MTEPLRRCAVCDSGGATWQHELHHLRAHFRLAGKGHVWGSPLDVCDVCEKLIAGGDEPALIARAAADPAEPYDASAITVLLAADLGGRPLRDVLPPGYFETVAAGFTAVELVTGAEWIVHAWPAEHVRSVPETRRAMGDDAQDGRCWFVRSPWPSISVEDALGIVWRMQESAPPAATVPLEIARARDVLAHDEAWARARLAP